MCKAIKFVIGLALLPFAYAISVSFFQQLNAHQDWSNLDLTTYWFAGGFVIWLLLFFMLPRPVLSYVLAHELTHALWGLLMGARVSRLRVSSKGGSVTLTKTNFLITLAPYFFPFYSILALIVYLLVNLKWDMSLYRPFWYAVFGLTWCFHLTFTVNMIGNHQPDIQEHGRIFSYIFIYCINLLTATILINLLAIMPLADILPAIRTNTTDAYMFCWEQIRPGIDHLKTRW